MVETKVDLNDFEAWLCDCPAGTYGPNGSHCHWAPASPWFDGLTGLGAEGWPGPEWDFMVIYNYIDLEFFLYVLILTVKMSVVVVFPVILWYFVIDPLKNDDLQDHNLRSQNVTLYFAGVKAVRVREPAFVCWMKLKTSNICIM